MGQDISRIVSPFSSITSLNWWDIAKSWICFLNMGCRRRCLSSARRRRDNSGVLGFVKFASLACVEMAIKFLDGLKVGDAFLAVKCARFPFPEGPGDDHA